MAEPIDMLFGLCTSVGPRNHVLGGGQLLSMGRGFLGFFRPIESIGKDVCLHVHMVDTTTTTELT